MIATTIVCSNMVVSSDVSGQKQLALPLICKRFLRVSSFSVCSNNWVTLFEFTIILLKSRQILIEDVILRAKLGVSVVRSKNSPLRTQDSSHPLYYIHAQNHPPPPPHKNNCKHRPPTLVTQATNYGKDKRQKVVPRKRIHYTSVQFHLAPLIFSLSRLLLV